MLKNILFILVITISTTVYAMKIVTIDNDRTNCLKAKAAAIPLTQEGLAEATKIAEKMKKTLLPLMPAAGLAAPQIGISKQVFIFSWDRTPEHLEVAINPSFQPIGEEMLLSWEACFSARLQDGQTQAAHLKRYKRILATYTDLTGKTHSKVLEDFAAKVFQHEYDHLQGIVNIRKEQAKTQIFKSQEAMLEFITNIKKKDSAGYTAPKDIE